MCGSGSAHAGGVSATVATVAIAAAATAITLVFVMRLPLCRNGCLMIAGSGRVGAVSGGTASRAVLISVSQAESLKITTGCCSRAAAPPGGARGCGKPLCDCRTRQILGTRPPKCVNLRADLTVLGRYLLTVIDRELELLQIAAARVDVLSLETTFEATGSLNRPSPRG
jgi:hypothetical protein